TLQIVGILVRRVNALGQLGASSPQRDVAPGVRQHFAEDRAPRPGAEHRRPAHADRPLLGRNNGPTGGLSPRNSPTSSQMARIMTSVMSRRVYALGSAPWNALRSRAGPAMTVTSFRGIGRYRLR